MAFLKNTGNIEDRISILLLLRNQFLIAYTTQHLQQEHSFYMSDRETKYRSLYLCDDYLTKIDLVIQTAAKHGSKWFCTENSFIRIFVFTEEMLIEKSNEWIKHYIIENIDNIEKESASLCKIRRIISIATRNIQNVIRRIRR